jgi:hypothetical protein
MVQRSGGDPLLVGNIVAQLHQYLERMRNRILEATKPMYNVEHGLSVYTRPFSQTLNSSMGASTIKPFRATRTS